MKFNPDKYLDRIHFSGNLEPNLEVLKKLQRQHLLQVPFENLDIHDQIPIVLDINSIYEKIVECNRGGFCYELNGLFYELLISLGYRAKRVSARVFENNGSYSPEFDHFAIVVEMEEMTYLVDVGFGEFIFEPLEMTLGKVQTDARGVYSIDLYGDGYFQVNKWEGDRTAPEFIFRDIGRELEDFTAMCYYHQSDPDSHFMKKRLVSLPTEQGRITISGNCLKIMDGNGVTETELRGKDDFESALWDHFKITLP